MAQEGSEGSVANSSSTSNYWDLQTNSLSNSWTNVIPWHPPNPHSNSSCEEEISISNSFTNTSNHSGLSDDSSRHHQLVAPVSSNELTGEPTSENHLWNQVLLNVGSSGDLHNSHDVGENFLEGLSSKNLSTEMFEPACDYLKKMDNSWEFPISPTFNNLQKQLNSFNGGLIEHERLNNLSNLVSNWSIALPFPEANCQISTPASTTCDMPMNSIHHQYSESDLSHQMKQNMSNSSSCSLVESISRSTNNNSGFFPCYGHELLRVENQQQEMESSSFLRSFKTNSIRNQMGNNSSVTGENNRCYYGISDAPAPWPNTKNLSDIISFNGLLNKPLVNIQAASKHCLKASNSPEINEKHGHKNSSSARGSGRGSGITGSEGKKKRSSSEDTSETVFKKPKQETSTVSSLNKAQVPKVKLADRITALQQIVSPFGKTDTASVLQEAIGYIKFLQEQVQLLSNPYVKPNTNKDPWGLLERNKDNKAAEAAKLDLKSRGLCLNLATLQEKPY
ncbi:Myc-type [Macleaya cordata]|uniref:Myc-type n=1 Tax=Macleaya cordata TaxID=56857 RepID=A0A200PZJ1_MACCD|nr:Myc-type [Macleaya cordata]